MNTRVVITGKHLLYQGKELGNVSYETMELKGDPRSWVDTVMKKPSKVVYSLISSRAASETNRYPFQPGHKMRGNAFWRNALSYLIRKYPNITN